MENLVALLALLLFWAGLIWLPLNLYRALVGRPSDRRWTLAAIISFPVVLLGFTFAMTGTTLLMAFAWSAAWVVPVALTWVARAPADTAFRGLDPWIALVAFGTFVLVAGRLPGLLHAVSDGLW